jgi:predicted AAA+ superfamily ATPase
MYKIHYYDIKGRSVLITKGKYYATDLGLLTSKIDPGVDNITAYRIENLVLLSLLERGYKVYTAKDRYGHGIDFVIVKDKKISYIQVTHTFDEGDYDRETRSLLNIKGGYSKYILCMKNNYIGDAKGIIVLNIEK